MTNLRVELAAKIYQEVAADLLKRGPLFTHDERLTFAAQDCLAMADIFIEQLNAEQTKS